MQIIVKPVSAANRADFSVLQCEKNGLGWCNCVAWWVPSWHGFGDRTAQQNLDLRNQLFDQGEYDGYLLYLDGTVVGWCQCGPRDRLKKLVSQYGLTPAPDIWAITCFALAPDIRGKGLAHALMVSVVADLSSRGVKYVQGFPRIGAGLDSEEVWTGTESIFHSANFLLERAHEKFPIYGLKLGK